MSASPVATVAGWDRSTPWVAAGSVPLGADVGHPQGLGRHDGDWWLSTVVTGRADGRLLRLSDQGEQLDAWELGDGERFHPGGCSWVDVGHGPELWLAVAEYRPDSTTTVHRAGPDGRPEPVFGFPDHLGAVVAVDARHLFAVTWGSRRVVLLDRDGRVVASRRNPSHHVDHQDVQLLGDGVVLCTGVAVVAGPVEPLQLGGLALWDVAVLAPTYELPVPARVPSGRSATFNPTHLEVEAGTGTAILSAVPDDGRASLHRWRIGVQDAASSSADWSS